MFARMHTHTHRHTWTRTSLGLVWAMYQQRRGNSSCDWSPAARHHPHEILSCFYYSRSLSLSLSLPFSHSLSCCRFSVQSQLQLHSPAYSASYLLHLLSVPSSSTGALQFLTAIFLALTKASRSKLRWMKAKGQWHRRTEQQKGHTAGRGGRNGGR